MRLPPLLSSLQNNELWLGKNTESVVLIQYLLYIITNHTLSTLPSLTGIYVFSKNFYVSRS